MPSSNTYHLTCFSLIGCGVSLHSCSSKAQPLLLTLDEGYLLTATPPDLERGVAPLGPPAPHSHRSLNVGLLLSAATPDLGRGVVPPSRCPNLGCWVAPLVCACITYNFFFTALKNLCVLHTPLSSLSTQIICVGL